MDINCEIEIPQLAPCEIPVGGCCDYNQLTSKPSINGVELVGNRSSKEIHVQHEMDEITYQQIDTIIYGKESY